MSTENWRAVPGYEGAYEVSDHGRVRSLDRIVPGRWGSQMKRGRVLRPNRDRDGYAVVALSSNGIARTTKVHHLVLITFVGPRPIGLEALHNDGDLSNNTPANLAWGTSSQNAYDRVRHGTHRNSRKTHCPYGHPYTEANTRMDGGSRRCRICKRRRDRAYKAGARKSRSVLQEA